MAMRLVVPATHGPRRAPLRTTGSVSILALRILARPLGLNASAAISGTTLDKSRMRPLPSMMPGFSRPAGPKRTSFMDLILLKDREGRCGGAGSDHASPPPRGQAPGAG